MNDTKKTTEPKPCIRKTAGKRWMRTSQDRDTWKNWKERLSICRQINKERRKVRVEFLYISFYILSLYKLSIVLYHFVSPLKSGKC